MSPIVDQPGVYDLPADIYHGDPVPGGSLSSSGARLLLPPSCPAHFHHQAEHGRAPKREFDLGHAAHRLVLGVGPELVSVEADSWRTKKAQQKRDEAYAAGAVPLLEPEHGVVQEMAAALRAHPVASALFNPERGRAEQSLFWFDAEFGVWRRARLDWLPDVPAAGRRLIIPDYKTTTCAEPVALGRTMAIYGYHQQADWYTDGVQALGLDGHHSPAFVLVFQEKHAPYLITIAEPDRGAMERARVRNRKALDVYRTCQKSGQWPGYSDGVIALTLPGWAEIQHDIAAGRGDFDLEETR